MAATAQAVAGEAPRIVGKKQLCGLLGWSRPTLDRRIDQDAAFPIRQRGDQRGGWEFDAADVFAYLGLDDPPPAIDDDGDEAMADAPAPEQPAPLARVAHQGEATARQRRDSVQAALLEDRLRKSRGELVDAADLKIALSTAVTKLATSLNALPDILVRRLSLPESAGLVVRQEIEDARRAFFAQLRDVLEPASPDE
ncbi:hypothetical protein [Phenylobacterium sp.]|uniref:hypothetical protein n=1 Tax=Phenylobacterium sp. TaxID=1871053 RepID=UPI0035AE222F